jgi:hypothetical protein
MRRTVSAAKVQWEVQDLREQLVIAQAELVKTERVIREIVRHPRNRAGVFGAGDAPLYTDPARAVDALREMGRLAYLVYPGRKNRIKPGVLLRQYEGRITAVVSLEGRLEALEAALREAGVNLDVLPG